MAVVEIGRRVKNGIMYAIMKEAATNMQYAVVAYSIDKGIKKAIIEATIEDVVVTEICAGAFAQMPNLEYVVISENTAISIDDAAFANCPRLKEFHSSAQNTSFGTQVFRDCVQLKEIWVTGDLFLLGQNIFENCNNLQKLNADIAKVNDFAFVQSGYFKQLFVAENAKFSKNSLVGLRPTNIQFYGNIVMASDMDGDNFQDFDMYCRKWSNVADFAYDGISVNFW